MEREQKIEKLEKEPKISYHIFYSPHETAKDFEKLEEVFKQADIYVPEAPGCDSSDAEFFNKISQGEMDFDEIVKKASIDPTDSMYKELKFICGSKKTILFVDIPGEHKLVKQRSRLNDLGRKSLDLFLEGSFQRAISKMQECIEDSVKFDIEREEFIKENLKKQVKRTITDSSELKDKKEVSVLLRLGTFHTGLYHKLKKEEESGKEDFQISRQFNCPSSVFCSLNELERGLLLSKNKEISEELLARGIIEKSLSGRLFSLTQDSNKATEVVRKISSKLELEDIKKISEELGEDPRKRIFSCLEERGIKIPKTEKEMDEMIKK